MNNRYEITEYRISERDYLQIERLGSTHELCAQSADSMIVGAIRQLLADIAAVTAERDSLSATVKFEQARLQHISQINAELRRDMETTSRYCSELNDSLIKVNAEAAQFEADRDQLRARLAAIEAAPTVATVCISPSSDFHVLKYSRYDIPQINGAELIARPAKD